MKVKVALIACVVIAGGVLGGVYLWPRVSSVPSPPAQTETLPRLDAPVPKVSAPRADEVVPTPPASGPTAESITGSVVDATGAPIPEARVAAYDPDRGAVTTTSSASGEFIVAGLEAGNAYRVSAVATGYNETAVPEIPAGTGNVTITLLPLSSAGGRVVDATTDEPVGEFEVAYVPIPPASNDDWRMLARSPALSWQAVSHPQGEFELQGINSNAPFAVAARAAGFAPGYVRCDPLGPGGRIDDVLITLESGAVMEGTVEDSTGNPVQSAVVSLGTNEEDLETAAESDSSGVFRMDGLSPGSYLVRAMHPAHDVAIEEVTVARGQAGRVRLRFAATGSIEGRITNGGVPVSGQQVMVSIRPGPDRRIKSAGAVTDQSGRYHIAGLPAGEYDAVATLVEPPSAMDSPRQLTLLATVEPGKATVADFPFSPATSIVEGTVTIGGLAPDEGEVKGVIGTGQGDAFFHVPIRDDGSFRVERLPAGAVYLEVIAQRGSEASSKRTLTFNLGEGETSIHDIAIDAETLVSGAVTGLAPGESAEVLAIRGEATIDLGRIQELMAIRERADMTATVDSTGAYRLEGLDPGEYSIVAISFNPDDDEGNPLDSLRAAIERVSVAAGASVEVNLAP